MRPRFSIPIVVVLVAIAIALIWRAPGPAPAPPAEAASPEAPPQTFEQRYDLHGLAVRFVPTPFFPERLAFYHRSRPDQVAELPNGPDAMLVIWKDGNPRIETATWGAGDPERGGFRMDTLVQTLLGVPDYEIDAVNGLKYLQLHGDIVIDGDAPREERRVALENLVLAATGARLAIKDIDMEQPLILLQGSWHYQPAPGSPWVNRNDPPPVLEIYGAHLDSTLEGRMAFSEGTVENLGAILSNHLQKPVSLQVSGAPPRIRWYYNYKGDGTEESAAKARDVNLVLAHICEQTGLTRQDETRKTRRLSITQISGPILP